MSFWNEFGTGLACGYNNRRRFRFGLYTNPTGYNNTFRYLETCYTDLDCSSGLRSWVDGGQPGVLFGGHGNDYLINNGWGVGTLALNSTVGTSYGFGGIGFGGIGVGFGSYGFAGGCFLC
ncbi:MAG: hypothetical protein NC200_02900 [Candidatus Gastranaerophilales bacterium]|nr:hypothetical protein [Candidatus Gastranaerophilales bacterium]